MKRVGGRVAFSLVELMVVITVVAILASVGVGYYGSYKYRAQMMSIVSVARDEIMQRQIEYYNKYGAFANANELPGVAGAGGGCNSCAALDSLGPENEQYLNTIWVLRDVSGCVNAGAVDLEFNDTMTGYSQWVRLRVFHVDDTFVIHCASISPYIDLPNCDDSWANNNVTAALACP